MSERLKTVAVARRVSVAGLVILVTGALLVTAPGLSAADDRPEHGWGATLLYDFQSFSSDRADWHTYRLLGRRQLPWGLVELELIRTHRFDEEDEAVAIGTVVSLWRSAYATIRFQAVIDPDVLPPTDGMAELFQGLPGGWELSAGYRNLDVPAAMVHVVTAGIAKYIGDDWYLRQRTIVSITGGESDVFVAALARRYFKVPDDFVQVDAGFGREVVDVAAGPRVLSREVTLLGARGQWFFVPRVGLALGATYRDEHGGPVNLGIAVELLTRW